MAAPGLHQAASRDGRGVSGAGVDEVGLNRAGGARRRGEHFGPGGGVPGGEVRGEVGEGTRERLDVHVEKNPEPVSVRVSTSRARSR